jgi:hypothetical protein
MKSRYLLLAFIISFSIAADWNPKSNKLKRLVSLDLPQDSLIKTNPYFLESAALSANPLAFIRGYLPLTLEIRISRSFSFESGPALVTYPYFYTNDDNHPTVDKTYLIERNYLPGEFVYGVNLGWESAVKYYFRTNIWRSGYASIFHSYRRTTVNLTQLGDGSPDIQDFAVYSRHHFGFKHGRRFFIFDYSDSWVADLNIGVSYGLVRSRNFSGVPIDGKFDFGKNIFLHGGLSIGYLWK